MFLPLTASTTSVVKNDHAHVITQDICNKFIEIKLSVLRMYGFSVIVSVTPSTTSKTINRLDENRHDWRAILKF